MPLLIESIEYFRSFDGVPIEEGFARSLGRAVGHVVAGAKKVFSKKPEQPNPMRERAKAKMRARIQQKNQSSAHNILHQLPCPPNKKKVGGTCVPYAKKVAQPGAKPQQRPGQPAKKRAAPPPLPRRPLKCGPGQVSIGGKCLNKPSKGRNLGAKKIKQTQKGMPGYAARSHFKGSAAHLRYTRKELGPQLMKVQKALSKLDRGG